MDERAVNLDCLSSTEYMVGACIAAYDGHVTT